MKPGEDPGQISSDSSENCETNAHALASAGKGKDPRSSGNEEQIISKVIGYQIMGYHLLLIS